MRTLWTRPTWYEVAGVTALAVWAVTLADAADRIALAAVLGVGAALSLLLRKSVPLVPLPVVLACLVATDAVAGFPGPDDPYLLMLVWASYSVGRHAAVRYQPWPAFLILLFVALTAPEARTAGDVLFPFFFAAVPWLAGLALQLSTARAQHAERRAGDLAAEMLTVAGRAEVDERLRIARELHDVMGHTLTGLSLQAQTLRRRAAAGESVSESDLRTIEGSANALLSDVRRLVGLLNEDAGDPRGPLPGADDLESLVRLGAGPGQVVTLATSGEPQPIPPALSTTLYRMCQEALTNAARHGAPGTVAVEVTWSEGWVQLEVSNPVVGEGATDESLASAGNGLRGMRERAALHGGRLQLSQRDDRWTVTVSMPTPVSQVVT